jgi:outer membrane lipoprotein LolB
LILRRFAVAALGAVLAACASTPPADGGWTTGRLSLRVDAMPDRAAQSVAAAFELRGDARAGDLNLVSPLGTRLAQARWSEGGAVLSTPDGERRFTNLDDLAEQSLGERVPLAALPDWIAGRPWPGAPSRAAGVGFEQLGWAVDLSARAEGRIVARRAAPPAVTLRIVLDKA